MKSTVLKNRFLVISTIIIIAMVVFFIVFIKTYWDNIKTKRLLVKKEKTTLEMIEKTGTNNPTDPKIKAYLDYKQKLELEYQQCLAYYKEIDKAMEKWFDGIKMDQSGNPTEESFLTAYNNAKTKLIGESLNAQNIKVVPETEEEVMDEDRKAEILGFTVPTDKTQYKAIQKRFWIQKRLIEALSLNGLEINKCGAIKVRKTAELVKTPDNLGVMIPFELTVYLPYKNIGRLFSSITETSKGGPFLIIEQTKITRASKQGEEIKEITVLTQGQKQWEAPQDLPLVKVFIVGSTIDFEIP